MLMNSRVQLRETLSFSQEAAPPRYESEFSDDVVTAWKAKNCLGGASPVEYFRLDRREDLPVEWRPLREDKAVPESQADLESFRRAYDPDRADKLPCDWAERLPDWRDRDYALSISPWNEGFFQVISIRDWRSFHKAIRLLHDQPTLVRAVMEHHAGYLDELIERVLTDVEVDYAVLYEPIASNHAPVVSPATYARLALPAMRRVVDSLERHGVAFRFVWTAGEVRSLIPHWLEAGINGLVINQAGMVGISYAALRREFDPRLRFFGGIDWRAVARGPEAIDEVLDQTVRPLLEQGGYVPYLDDTVRANLPFDAFRYYRRRLDDLIAKVLG